jgi:hypothetical protein
MFRILFIRFRPDFRKDGGFPPGGSGGTGEGALRQLGIKLGGAAAGRRVAPRNYAKSERYMDVGPGPGHLGCACGAWPSRQATPVGIPNFVKRPASSAVELYVFECGIPVRGHRYEV